VYYSNKCIKFISYYIKMLLCAFIGSTNLVAAGVKIVKVFVKVFCKYYY